MTTVEVWHHLNRFCGADALRVKGDCSQPGLAKEVFTKRGHLPTIPTIYAVSARVVCLNSNAIVSVPPPALLRKATAALGRGPSFQLPRLHQHVNVHAHSTARAQARAVSDTPPLSEIQGSFSSCLATNVEMDLRLISVGPGSASPKCTCTPAHLRHLSAFCVAWPPPARYSIDDAI